MNSKGSIQLNCGCILEEIEDDGIKNIICKPCNKHKDLLHRSLEDLD